MPDRCFRVIVVLMFSAGALACESDEHAVVAAVTAHQIAHAMAYTDSLIAVGRTATTPAAVPEQTAVALGYLERLRLGLGGPFRLIDYVLRDRRLAPSVRHQVAWTLLAQTLHSVAYQVDPATLDDVGGTTGRGFPQTGHLHVAIIDSVVAAAEHPRSGELAVRLAYTIAAAEGLVGPWAPVLSARAAALARDRALAARDARALLRAATRQQTDPITLVPVWREARRFAVEQPLFAPLPDPVEHEAVVAAPRLLTSLRRIAEAADTMVDTLQRPDRRGRPLLGYAAARRLADLSTVRAAPPQAPVVITLRSHQRRILGQGGPTDQRAARARFVRRAHTEETLAAEYALAVGPEGRRDAEVSRVTLAAAVSLRVYAQEPVWHLGDGGPTVHDLKRRFGLAAISFDEDVPSAWRPYFLRMLASAIDDLHHVLPAASLRGLGVHFGETPIGETAFAFHDPQTRTIFLPASTGAGVIAHELAHDLDWQTARLGRKRRAGYSTDRAIREGWERPAASLRRLTPATLIAPTPGDPRRLSYDQRPTEVFARHVDWFVAVSLARAGRMNGYLSAVQDDFMTGYVSVEPPDITGAAGQAIVDLLAGMTFVLEPTREWFLELYGHGRPLTPFELVRSVLEVPSPDRPRGLPPERRSLLLSFPTISTGMAQPGGRSCGGRGTGQSHRTAASRRRLVELAAEVRARGILHTWARDSTRVASESPAVRALRGGPWSPALVDTAVLQIRTELLERVRAFHAARRPLAGRLAPSSLLGACEPS